MEEARKLEGEAVMVPRDPWVNLRVASQLRGRHRMTVLLEALDGKIRHQKVAGRRVFHRDDLERLHVADAAERTGESPDTDGHND